MAGSRKPSAGYVPDFLSGITTGYDTPPPQGNGAGYDVLPPEVQGPQPTPMGPVDVNALLGTIGLHGDLPPPPAMPGSVLHPDLSDLHRRPMESAPISMPQITAEDAERLRHEEQDRKTGLKVAALNAEQHRKDREAGIPTGKQSNAIFASTSGGEGAPKGNSGGKGGSAGMSASAKAGVRGADDVDFETPYQTSARSAQRLAMGQEHEAQANEVGAEARSAFLANAASEQEHTNKARESMIAGHMNHIATLNEEVANQKIDTDHWFKTRNTGQQAALFLAAGLGGFLSGFRGGPNQGLEMAQHAIDRDLDKQRYDIENKRKGVEGEQGLLADLYKRFHNMDEAQLAARGLMLDKLTADTQALVQHAKGEQALANGGLMVGSLQEKKAEWELKMREYYDNLAVKLAMHRKTGGSGANTKEMEKYANELQQRKIPQAEAGLDELEREVAENKGEVPGSSPLGRVGRFLANSKIPIVAGAANQLRGEKARVFDQTVSEAAQDLVGLTGQRGEGAVKRKEAALGAGRREDFLAALHRERDATAIARANAAAGFDPSVPEIVDARERAAHPKRSAPLNLKPMSQK